MLKNRLTDANCRAKLNRSKQLLQCYSDRDVDFITVATPKNAQNDLLYVPTAMKKRDVTAACLLRTRATFCQSLMVSVGVLKLGCTHLIFVDPGVKINGCYYRCLLYTSDAADE